MNQLFSPSEQRRSTATLLAALIFLAAAVVPVSWAAPAFGDDRPAVAEHRIATAEDLSALVHSGRFDQLLTELKDVLPADGEPRVQGLIAHIERYNTTRTQQQAERLEAYREKLEEIAQRLEADQFDRALYAAAEAQSLALDKAAVLEEPIIKDLLTRASEAAREAEEASEWLDALSLYRAMETLRNQDGTHHDDIQRVAHHLRILRIYVPERFQELYTARVERLAEFREEDDEGEEFEPLALDDDGDWVQRLAQVEMQMVRQAFVHAASHHIDAQGYKPLMAGSIDALRILTNTPGLEAAFPGMVDAQKLAAFQQELDKISVELQAREGNLSYLEVDGYIRRVIEANQRTINLPQNVLAFELAEGATGTLDDYSTVVWPADLAELMRTMQGNFTGVGILISRRNQRLTVSSPLPHGPAIEAGIRFDDVIVSVDGESTENWSLKRAVERITGPEGSRVTLGIEREGVDEPILFELSRARIKIESVRGWELTDDHDWNYFIDPELRIGYVRLTQFIPQTADDLDAAVAKMQEDGPINGLILDLRFNPGGLLRSAVAVADRFIDAGTIVSTVDVNGRQRDAQRATQRRTYRPFPVVVLINQGSASASEIVAGALQEYGRAQIVGTRSYGKGSVQDMYELLSGRALLKLTTQYYRLPDNRILHRRPHDTVWGVEPDLPVDVTDQQVADAVRFRQKLDVVYVADQVLDPDEPLPQASQLLEDGIDPQLDAALLSLRAQLIVNDLGSGPRRARAQ